MYIVHNVTSPHREMIRTGRRSSPHANLLPTYQLVVNEWTRRKAKMKMSQLKEKEERHQRERKRRRNTDDQIFLQTVVAKE